MRKVFRYKRGVQLQEESAAAGGECKLQEKGVHLHEEII